MKIRSDRQRGDIAGELVHVRSRCQCWSVSCLWGLRCGLTLAESSRVVDVLLAHVTHSFPPEALIGEGMAACFGELQIHRRVKREYSHSK